MGGGSSGELIDDQRHAKAEEIEDVTNGGWEKTKGFVARLLEGAAAVRWGRGWMWMLM